MKYLVFLFVLFSHLCFGQMYDNNFILGNYCAGCGVSKLSFNNSMQVDTNFSCYNLPMHTSALTMSDANGYLLFYTNGIYVHNAKCQKINSSDTNKLSPGADTEFWANWGSNKHRSLLSLPHTDSSNLYYLFHNSLDIQTAANGLGEYFYYTLIDMADTVGYIRSKNQKLLFPIDSFMGYSYPVATKHANGRDWWLVLPAFTYQRAFHSFLIKGDSIIRQPIQAMQDTFIATASNAHIFYRETIFNNKGTQLINFSYKNQLQIYDFNRCTGQISLAADIFVDDTTQNRDLYYGGAAVSPNDRFLYLATKWYILQYDLEATDIAASKEIVATYDGTYIYGYTACFFNLASTPDGKIYGHSNSDYWHIIDSPNLKGVACSVRQRAVYLGYLLGNTTLFTYPNYRLGADTSCWLPNGVAAVAERAQELVLYPNPAQNMLILQSNISFAEGTVVEIYNSLGQLLYNQTIDTSSERLEIDVSILPIGSYFVRVSSDRTVFSGQFIINR